MSHNHLLEYWELCLYQRTFCHYKQYSCLLVPSHLHPLPHHFSTEATSARSSCKNMRTCSWCCATLKFARLLMVYHNKMNELNIHHFAQEACCWATWTCKLSLPLWALSSVVCSWEKDGMSSIQISNTQSLVCHGEICKIFATLGLGKCQWSCWRVWNEHAVTLRSFGWSESFSQVFLIIRQVVKILLESSEKSLIFKDSKH